MNTAVCQLISLTRFLSVTSYIHPQNTLCWWTVAARISSVSHSCLMAGKISSTNLILQVAMLAVSATTHIYVLIDVRNRVMLIPCPGPGQLDLLRNLTLSKTVFWSMILQLKDRCFPLSSLHREAGAPVAMTVRRKRQKRRKVRG